MELPFGTKEQKEAAKKLQDDVGKGLDGAKKKIGEGIDEAGKQAKDALDKVKDKLTPENIKAMKEIIKQVKEVLSNLPLDKVPGLDKVIEKLDKIVEKLDPVENEPESAAQHIKALRGFIDNQLFPYVDETVDLAKLEISMYLRRVALTFDLLLLLNAELDRY